MLSQVNTASGVHNAFDHPVALLGTSDESKRWHAKAVSCINRYGF